MSENCDSGRVGGYVAMFAIGAAIGAGVALLYAPRSGRETRELLAEKRRLAQGKVQDALGDAKGFVRGKQAELKAAYEAGKQAMREERTKQEREKA